MQHVVLGAGPAHDLRPVDIFVQGIPVRLFGGVHPPRFDFFFVRSLCTDCLHKCNDLQLSRVQHVADHSTRERVECYRLIC